MSFLGQQNSDIELVLHDKLISKEAAKMLNTRINRHAEVRQMKLLYVYSPPVLSPNSNCQQKENFEHLKLGYLYIYEFVSGFSMNKDMAYMGRAL